MSQKIVRNRLMRILDSAKAKKLHNQAIIALEFRGYQLLTKEEITKTFNYYFPNTRVLKIRKFKMYRKVGQKVYIRVDKMLEIDKWAKE